MSGPTTTWAGAVGLGIVLVLVAGGCGKQEVEHPSATAALESARHANAGEPVARVDGREVSVDEFEGYWKEHPNLSRDEALDRLLARDLLAAAALERALIDEDALRTARKRAMVRQLLDATVEQEVSAEDLTDDEIDKGVEALDAEVGHPAGLRASHLVVMVDPDKKKKASKKKVAEWMSQARTWLDKIRGELPEKPTVLELMDAERRYNEVLPEPFRARVDLYLAFPVEDTTTAELPEGWNRVVTPFRERAIELAREDRFGEVSEPVETRFGWHVVVVDDALPGTVADANALREVAEWRLLRRKRQLRFGELFEAWAKDAQIQTYPEIISQAEEVNE